MDSYEEMIIPEAPKALPNEQLFIYVPIASNDNPGIAKFDDKHFSVDPDGTVHSMSVVTTGDITISPSQWTDATPTIAQFSISPLKMGHALILMPADDPTKQAAIQARLSMYPAPFPSIGEDVVEFIRAEADNAPAVNMNFVYLVFKTGSVDTRPAIALVGVDAYGEGGGGTASGVDESAVRAIITAMLGNVANERQYSASNPPPYPVTSVNDKTGAVNLNATDVGARPSTWTPTAADVDADPAGTAERKTGDLREEVNGKLADYDKSTAVNNKISSHDTSAESHQDLRQELRALADRLNAALNSDDTSLDDFREIVAYIKSNKTLIDGITSSKVNVTDIVDNLVTNKSNMPLSAAQGVALKLLIDSLEEIVDGKVTAEQVAAQIATELGNYPTTTDMGEAISNATKDLAPKSSVPTKVSQLTNDSGYLTNHQSLAHLLPKNQGVDNAGKLMMVADDGSVTYIEIADLGLSGGDVVGNIDSDNNIVLTGDLAPGTYTFAYLVRKSDGTTETATIGTYTVEDESETKTYTITWANYDGTVLETDTVTEGETPTYDGATPTRAADDQYTYTFKGWDKTVVAATADVTYTATYTQIPVTPSYTNLFTAETALLNTRIAGTGELKTDENATGKVTTDFITIPTDKLPFSASTKIYIKGATFTADGNTKIATYQASTGTDYSAMYSSLNGSSISTVDEGNGVISVSGLTNSFPASVKRMAFTLKVKDTAITADDVAGTIITIDEPIS